jgi:mono/diheme cytochrome c family protein
MQSLLRFLAVALTTLALPLAAQTALPLPAPSRGELLYQTHCVACHDRQVHWREKKLVGDWASLVAEVQRWQRNLGVGWTDDAVDDVARYLNDAIYRLPDHSRKQAA